MTLKGEGNAVIDGGGQDVVTIDGAQRITILDFTVRNGNIGILGTGGASFMLSNLSVRDNANTGIRVEANSSSDITDITTRDNGFNGIDIDLGSVVHFSGEIVSRNNGVFGIILGNNSSATFTEATVTANNNGLGIQIGINSSAIISDAETTVTALNNSAPGLTLVSASHLFVFGGKIESRNNQTNGISIFSNSGIELDNGASVMSRNNNENGILLENSSLNMFNMPIFPGSTVMTSNNGKNGLSAIAESVIDMSGDAALTSRNNAEAGLLLDNGSTATLINATISNNNNDDVDLRFGARADLNNNTIGSIICDETVLIRGDSGVECPSP